MTQTLARNPKKAIEVCKNFQLSDSGKKLLRDDISVRQFVDLLAAKELFIDALRLLAHALPKPEAVRWACRCVRSVNGAGSGKGEAAVQAAEKWAADPNEDNRRAAQTAAEPAELGTPAGCAAMAAFWSGGSLGPANVPAIPPGEHLTAQGVVGSVMLAAVQTEPAQAAGKYRKFIELAIDMGNSKKLW